MTALTWRNLSFLISAVKGPDLLALTGVPALGSGSIFSNTALSLGVISTALAVGVVSTACNWVGVRDPLLLLSSLWRRSLGEDLEVGGETVTVPVSVDDVTDCGSRWKENIVLLML